ncbi:MAG: hypothetical protein ABSG46_20270 [Candidatus Binataceae bacterium]|jgi:hypothetical protein
MADTSEDTIEGSVVGQIVPAVRLRSDAEVGASKRMPLFYIDDKEYTVPAKPAPNVGLRYLYLLHTKGEAEANYFLLNSLLGNEGYRALMTYDKLTQKDFDDVMSRAVAISTGPKERKRSSNGSSRTGQNGSSAQRRSSGPSTT